MIKKSLLCSQIANDETNKGLGEPGSLKPNMGTAAIMAPGAEGRNISVWTVETVGSTPHPLDGPARLSVRSVCGICPV